MYKVIENSKKITPDKKNYTAYPVKEIEIQSSQLKVSFNAQYFDTFCNKLNFFNENLNGIDNTEGISFSYNIKREDNAINFSENLGQALGFLVNEEVISSSTYTAITEILIQEAANTLVNCIKYAPKDQIYQVDLAINNELDLVKNSAQRLTKASN